MSNTDELVVEEEAEAPTSPDGPRQARLRLNRIEPWSVMKTSFVVSLGLAIVVIVAIVLIWLLLTSFGVFDTISKTVNDVAGPSSGFDIMELLSFGRVLGYAVLLAVFEIVMTSILSTLVAAIYNVTTRATRGFEVTLAED